jgi:hypothetical protein
MGSSLDRQNVSFLCINLITKSETNIASAQVAARWSVRCRILEQFKVEHNMMRSSLRTSLNMLHCSVSGTGVTPEATVHMDMDPLLSLPSVPFLLPA